MSHEFAFTRLNGKDGKVTVTRRTANGGGVYIEVDRTTDDQELPNPVLLMFDRSLAAPIARAILEEVEDL